RVCSKHGIAIQHQQRGRPRSLRQCDIQQVGREHLRQSVLPQADDVAGATEPEVELGKVEPTPRLRDRFQPTRALLVDAALEKQAVRLVLATADSPAELMQLREPEPLSAL